MLETKTLTILTMNKLSRNCWTGGVQYKAIARTCTTDKALQERDASARTAATRGRLHKLVYATLNIIRHTSMCSTRSSRTRKMPIDILYQSKDFLDRIPRYPNSSQLPHHRSIVKKCLHLMPITILGAVPHGWMPLLSLKDKDDCSNHHSTQPLQILLGGRRDARFELKWLSKKISIECESLIRRSVFTTFPSLAHVYSF